MIHRDGFGKGQSGTQIKGKIVEAVRLRAVEGEITCADASSIADLY